jgi:hypothetical protein
MSFYYEIFGVDRLKQFITLIKGHQVIYEGIIFILVFYLERNNDFDHTIEFLEED